MREIKFRAWDEQAKKMCSLCKITHRFELIDYGCTQGFIPMQYTGLKDAKGFEIYEGDILALDVEDEDEHGQYIFFIDRFAVIWSDGAFWRDGGDLLCEYPHHEVIGNIYEHRELLGDNANS